VAARGGGEDAEAKRLRQTGWFKNENKAKVKENK